MDWNSVPIPLELSFQDIFGTSRLDTMISFQHAYQLGIWTCICKQLPHLVRAPLIWNKKINGFVVIRVIMLLHRLQIIIWHVYIFYYFYFINELCLIYMRDNNLHTKIIYSFFLVKMISLTPQIKWKFRDFASICVYVVSRSSGCGFTKSVNIPK